MEGQVYIKDDYDSEPVKYCTRCYSLKIKYEEAIDTECCGECGCPDTAETSIENWERMYEGRYGHKYAVKSNDPKRSPLFKLSISKLKEKVLGSSLWRNIIRDLYPRFPEGLSKKDSIVLFFDRLVRDNRMDDLRLLIVKLKGKL